MEWPVHGFQKANKTCAKSNLDSAPSSAPILTGGVTICWQRIMYLYKRREIDKENVMIKITSLKHVYPESPEMEVNGPNEAVLWSSREIKLGN
jgi:hypothetical protein